MQNVDVLLMRSSIQLTPGRYKLAASQMLARMSADERRLFGEAAQAVMDAADRAESLAAARQDQTKNVYGEEARAADLAADAVVSLVESTLEGYARVYDVGTPRGDAARALLERFFSKPLKDITQAPYADELIQLERVVRAASEPSLAKAIAAISGLEPLLGELAARTTAYRAALDRQAKSGVRYEDVRASVEACDRRQGELLALVLGHFRGDAPGAVKRRSELVEPYVVLMNDLRERYRRRLPPGEVDGATGALLGDAEAAEGAPAAEPEPEPAD